MPTTVFGQYIGFWFGSLTAIFFYLVFITCRVMPPRVMRLWGKWWNPVHKFAWAGAIISSTMHIILITSAYVFNAWL